MASKPPHFAVLARTGGEEGLAEETQASTPSLPSRQDGSHGNKVIAAKKVQDELHEYLVANAHSKIGTRDHIPQILRRVETIIELLTESEELKKMVSSIQKNLEELKVAEERRGGRSFAQVVASPPLVNKRAVEPREVVIVQPTEGDSDAEKTKMTIKEKINPQALKIGVRGLRKLRNGAIAIEVEKASDKLKLQKAVVEIPGMTAREPKKRTPKVIIHSVPKDVEKGQ
ncbi:uncharacterized protein LOC111633874 [Centruroides sculpturatus]|uniref:uncharacterized protein LOC111633874 n=1 Tax=Centruroides sculpturatus TaxID=218467 RepID=UPI000C6DC913|nr:uncharacterized protein LOC111633874 [Centruroides sculpturatus]